jgi:stage II sporulation protein D
MIATLPVPGCWWLSMRRPAAVLAVVAASLAAGAGAPAARAAVTVRGHGWGHGVGMSQYGAYGYALEEGRDHAFILGHFYPGTTLEHRPGAKVRVLLMRSRAPVVCGASRLVAADGRTVALAEGDAYRATPSGTASLALRDVTTGRRGPRVAAPATVTGGASWCLRGRAQNGVRGGAYRGSALLERAGARVLVVDRVPLERYLLGVVGSEMPATWPAEALAAQADVARSYALRALAPAAPFDLYADTRSQVYRGLAGESPATSAAVRTTRGEVVTYAGAIAQTFFFSSSGGRTAGNDEAWGGAPIPYLRSVEDPYDTLSPYHRWSVTFTTNDLRRRLRSVSPGKLRRLRVSARTLSGRAGTVALTGSRGAASVPASEIEALLGLRSTWFSFRGAP